MNEEHTVDLNQSVVTRLDHLAQLLLRLIGTQERESDIDTTWVVGGSPGAASVVSIALPQVLKHVELTFSVDNPSASALSVALLDGNIPLALAQGLHNVAASPPTQSGAIVASAGGTKTVRDQLGESGYLTVFFSGAGTDVFASVRVRSLSPHRKPLP